MSNEIVPKTIATFFPSHSDDFDNHQQKFQTREGAFPVGSVNTEIFYVCSILKQLIFPDDIVHLTPCPH